MKNITIIKIIIFITIITFIFPTAALAATLSLSPATGTFNKGCSVTLTINLNTQSAETDGTDAILVYDPTRVTATSILNGTIYSDYPGSNIDSQTGRITVSGLASVSSPFTGSGILATVNLTVLEGAPAGATAITFDFDPNNKAKTTDSNVVQRGTVADVLSSVGNGSFVIGSGTCAAQAPTGPTIIYLPQGQTGIATPSAGPAYPTPGTYLPPAGTQELTFTLAIIGTVLTILGILGLAIL